MHPKRFLLLCGLVTGALLAAMVLPVPAFLRIVIALPLVFVLPGTAMLRALDLRFPSNAHAPIVIGTSLAITVLSGLVLDWLGGLTPFGWAAWLGGLSMLTGLLSLHRPQAAVPSLNGPAGIRRNVPGLRRRHGVMLAATAVVLVVTVQGAIRTTAAYRPYPTISFWMLPAAPASDVYMIGIRNDEGRPETYAVQLIVGQRITGKWQDLILAPGQSISYPVMLQAGAPAQAWLYRAEQPDVIYRRVTAAGSDAAATGGGA